MVHQLLHHDVRGMYHLLYRVKIHKPSKNARSCFSLSARLVPFDHNIFHVLGDQLPHVVFLGRQIGVREWIPVIFRVDDLTVSQDLQMILHLSILHTFSLLDLVQNLINPDLIALFLPVQKVSVLQRRLKMVHILRNKVLNFNRLVKLVIRYHIASRLLYVLDLVEFNQ